jgi:hypothetical protein
MSTDIEKQSLEAHVELCAERYAQLKDKIENLDERTNKIEHMLGQIKEKLFSYKDESNKRYLAWSTAIIGLLISILIGVGAHFMNKLEQNIEVIRSLQSQERSK